MKKIIIGLIAALAVCLMTIAGPSCKQATDVNLESCQDNNEPFLGQLFFAINGEPTVAEDLQLTNLDTLGISYEYKDYECNLDGGKIYFKLDDGDWEVAKILPDGTPCSSAEAAAPVGIEETFPDLALGLHTFRTGWVDNCAVKSDEKSGEFTIIEAAADDSKSE